MSAAHLALRSGVPATHISRAAETGEGLDEDEIVILADELAVPAEALFVTGDLPLFPTVDFRKASPAVQSVERGTLEAISFVERLSSTFASLDLDTGLDPALDAISPDLTPQNAIALAEGWREHWGITNDEQLTWQDANKVYVSLRSYIESLGVLVLHRSFKTTEEGGLYIQLDRGPHVIVINTYKSSNARKLFTLAHEFCHVLLRKEGVSNPSILKNRVEKFCNKFAAYLLTPPKLIDAALERFSYAVREDDDFIRLFAKKLGISQEALILRLVEDRKLDRSFYAEWRSKFDGPVPLADQEDGGGGGGKPNVLQNKRTAYGMGLLRLLETARRRGQLDEIDVYRISGLKPQYQNQLFEVA